jgi:hypothetical protein
MKKKSIKKSKVKKNNKKTRIKPDMHKKKKTSEWWNYKQNQFRKSSQVKKNSNQDNDDGIWKMRKLKGGKIKKYI